MKKYLFFAAVILISASCEKDKESRETNSLQSAASNSLLVTDKTNTQSVPGGTGSECTISGNFVGTVIGTSPSNNGITASIAYQFMADNFLRGASSLAVPWSTWGGYRATCDSVVWMNYNPPNGGYYIVKGKFSNNRTVISGTWLNQSNPSDDYGNFTLTKQ
jgi:hypothetical protein